MKDSRAAEAITASTSTTLTGLCTPPVSAISVSVKTLSTALTAQANRVRRTSAPGLISSTREYAIAAASTTAETTRWWRSQSGPIASRSPIEATTAVRTATTVRARP